MSTITKKDLECYNYYLQNEEKSKNTIEKYLRDANAFALFLQGQSPTKELAISYKNKLVAAGYAPRSVNSMLASLNCLFTFLNRGDCVVKSLKIQRNSYCSGEKELTREEYTRLVSAARYKGNHRIDLLLQTVCGTGIRVSELKYITVEAVKSGRAIVSLKGKTRIIFIVEKLQKKLLDYARRLRISSGSVFVTRTGKPMDRTQVWREMKRLCSDAGVDPKKVFPHNLRHLFARTFYGVEKDIVKLADILGHNSVDTTRIYLVSTGAEHRRRLESLHLVL